MAKCHGAYYDGVLRIICASNPEKIDRSLLWSAVPPANAATLSASDSYLYLPIDSKRVIAIQDDGNQLGLLLMEGVGP